MNRTLLSLLLLPLIGLMGCSHQESIEPVRIQSVLATEVRDILKLRAEQAPVISFTEPASQEEN